MRILFLCLFLAGPVAQAAVLKRAWLMKTEAQLQIDFPEQGAAYLVNLELTRERISAIRIFSYGAPGNPLKNARDLLSLLETADLEQLHVTSFVPTDEFFGNLHSYPRRMKDSLKPPKDRLRGQLTDWLKRSLTHCELELRPD